MHTGSRAFCFLMALAATGAECSAAAAAQVPAGDSGHYRVEAKLVNNQDARGNFADVTIPTVCVANHVLAVIAVNHAISLPSGNAGETFINLTIRPDAKDAMKGGLRVSFVRSEIYPESKSPTPVFHVQRLAASLPPGGSASDVWFRFDLPAYDKGFKVGDADDRRMASIADANERQLLFVKTSRG